MIQIYLLILIIIFILFLILKKETFSTEPVSSCSIGQVEKWEVSQYLIGCSYNDNKLGVVIKLFWNKTKSADDIYYIILTETKEKATQIIKLEDSNIINIDKDGEKINSYILNNVRDNIIEGHTYNISLNIKESQESQNIRASNTLEITALKQQIPDNNIQLSGNCNKQTKLFDNLKNKTFDFYL